MVAICTSPVTPVTTPLLTHLPPPARVIYNYDRDGVFPLSWIPGTVNKHIETPVNAVWMNTSIGILLLIYGGSLAISPSAPTSPSLCPLFVVGNRFWPGPWNLGRWSRLSGSVASGFALVMMQVLCFPTVRGVDLDVQSMDPDWTVVAWGGAYFLLGGEDAG